MATKKIKKPSKQMLETTKKKKRKEGKKEIQDSLREEGSIFIYRL